MNNIFFNNKKMVGIIYIIFSGFFFALMSLFIKLAGDLPTMQKAFFRNAVAAVVAFFMLLKSKEGFKIKKNSYVPLLLRCLCGTIGIVCNFYAIDKISLADANILNKLSPFFAIIMSYFILKEKANRTEITCVVIAFIGAIFVVKPSFQMSFIYALIGVLGGLGAGMAYTFVRKLGKQGERGPVIVFAFSVFSSIFSLPFFVVQYTSMSLWQFVCLLLCGVSAAGGQLCITAAYTKAPAKEISVFDYSQVVFAAILGFVFLHQVPDGISIVGDIIIISSAIYKWIYINKRKE